MTNPKRYYLRKGKYGCYFYDKDSDIDLTLEMILNKLNAKEMSHMKAIQKSGSLTKRNINLRKEIANIKIETFDTCKANLEGHCSFDCNPCIYDFRLMIDSNGNEMTFKELWNKSNPK